MRNNEYFKELWTRNLLILIPVAIFLLINGIKKPSILLIALLLLFIFFMFTYRNVNRNIEIYFRSESPDKLVNYYTKTINIKTQDRDVMLCFCKSIVYCYYGYFDKVMESLRGINWNEKVPFLQAFEYLTMAQISYLRDKDFNEGLRLSLIAKQLSVTSNKYPGVNTGNDSFDTYIHVGEILINHKDHYRLNELEEKFKNTKFFIQKVLIAWCLSTVYIKNQMYDKAKEMNEYCVKSIPYCKPMFNEQIDSGV